MKSRRKNHFNITGCSTDNTANEIASGQQFSVLPIFPSATTPTCSTKRKSNPKRVGDMVQSTEEVIMTPCNTIILQTTIDGKIQVSRTQKERERNSDRLSLDRRGLTMFPILIGEAKLRLLSLQHNLLCKLERIALLCLPNLVFLDIYNNQLENMAALECLHHLRVLLLGKNRIKFIEGLSNMNRLEVLDLHGNQIIEIRELKSLKELKVLNLAGNEIKYINIRDLEGLCTLQELNLRRNQIRKVDGFEETPQLFKLFLSNNNINSIDDLSGIKKLRQLKELTLDGNPVLSSEDCILFVISYIPTVQIFGQSKITEDIRKVSKIWRLRREFNEKPPISFENDRQERHDDCDIKRIRSASENRATQLRKYIGDNKVKLGCKLTSKSLNRLACSAKPVRTPDKNAKARRASFSKGKTVSKDSCYGSETSVEYFRLPPILTSSLNSLDDGNVVLRNDPNTSMESNKSFGSIHCESDSSTEKSEETSASSESESKSIVEKNLGNDTVLAARTKPPSVEVVDSMTEKNLLKQQQEESKTSVISDGKMKLQKTGTPFDKTKEQGGDYLVQISGRYLIVTGRNSAKHIDKSWNVERAKDVTTIRFSCVSFNSLVPVFNRVKVRFPNAENLVFNECDFNYIGQLNSLADVQGVTSVEIQPERNEIVTKNWRSYAIFRLHHWGLKIINNVQITDEEVRQAKEEYNGLSEMVLWSLPESLLTPLLNKLRLEINSNISAKQWLYKADPALRSVICKEALQWRPTNILSQAEHLSREKGRETVTAALESACNIVLKLRKLDREWKSIMHQLVYDTLKDYSNVETFTEQQVSNLKPP